MSELEQYLRREERAIFDLRALYETYGYRRYKVGKFEEYDLYAHNKSFLTSESILTFTDTDGRLMALKPDVTLSIIKNCRDGEGLQKLYYNENVYRVTGGQSGFREIMQTGLECIGDLDLYSVCEVLMLAAKSLLAVSERSVLDLSHLDFLAGLLDETRCADETREAMLRCVGEKNVHGLRAVCDEAGVDAGLTDRICAAAGLYGPFGEALGQLSAISVNEKTDAALAELKEIYRLMCAHGVEKMLYLDFSIVNDMNYYNGVSFQGFVDGIPSGILSGGRYDNLMQKMGRRSGAIGFAVYLDQLERFGGAGREYDVDVLLLYGPEDDPAQVLQAVRLMTVGGKTVLAERRDTGAVRCRQKLRMRNGGLEILETDD